MTTFKEISSLAYVHFVSVPNPCCNFVPIMPVPILCLPLLLINLVWTNVFVHHYHLGSPLSVLRAPGVTVGLFIQFVDEFSVSQQNSPRRDAAYRRHVLDYTVSICPIKR